MRAPARAVASGALCLAGALFPVEAQTPLDVRLALVIGNAKYQHLPSLENAGNDARDLSAVFRRLGFQVVEVNDADRNAIQAGLQRTRELMHRQQALAIFYYAGHGVQLNWRNFMVPVDFRLSEPAEAVAQGVDLATVVSGLKDGGSRMSIIILDACRDNPFGAAARMPQGLAPMDAPPGTLLAYATQPGNVAEDGYAGDRNSPYAQALLKELRRPFVSVEDIFKRVRYQVRQKTKGKQIPWESTSLEEDMVFNRSFDLTDDENEVLEMARETRRREVALREHIAKASVQLEKLSQEAEERKRVEIEAGGREQLAMFRMGELRTGNRLGEIQAAEQALARLAAERLAAAEEAARLQQQKVAREEQARLERAQLEAELRRVQQIERIRLSELTEFKNSVAQLRETSALPEAQKQERLALQEKRDWDKLQAITDATALYNFIQKYPSGTITELAAARLETVAPAEIKLPPDQTGLVQSLEALRFQVNDSVTLRISDLLTGIESGRPTYRVIRADRETAEFDQGYKVTQSGAIIRTIGGANLEPYQQWLPSGVYQVGKKWRTQSTLTVPGKPPQWVRMEGKIVARETIQVPAGSFDTFKMVMEQMAEDGTRLKVTYWGQPDWGVAIKQIREVREANGRLTGEVYELVKRERRPAR